MHESNSRHYTQSLVNAKCLQDTTVVCFVETFFLLEREFLTKIK
jgi:hypothetical protein